MDNELVELAEIYRPPGFLLLALDDQGSRLGCVGLRDLGRLDGRPTGEVRRLFVRESGRGERLGAMLVDQLIAEAQQAGLQQLVLNTLPAMHEAISLYRGLGFESSEPYVEEPLEATLYFGLDIGDRSNAR